MFQMLNSTRSLSKLSLIIISLCLVTSCDKHLAVVAIPCEKFRDPKETIRKAYTQQISDKSPNSLEVTDKYIAWSKEHVKAGSWMVGYGVTTLNNTNAVYYENISELDLIQVKRRYEVWIRNKANGVKSIIMLRDKDLAVQSYSAIKCMMDKSAANKDTLY